MRFLDGSLDCVWVYGHQQQIGPRQVFDCILIETRWTLLPSHRWRRGSLTCTHKVHTQIHSHKTHRITMLHSHVRCFGCRCLSRTLTCKIPFFAFATLSTNVELSTHAKKLLVQFDCKTGYVVSLCTNQNRVCSVCATSNCNQMQSHHFKWLAWEFEGCFDDALGIVSVEACTYWTNTNAS